MTDSPPPVLLIVEDSDEDFVAFERILLQSAVHCQVRRAVDGDDALNFLFCQEPYARPNLAPRPSLILLDMNLPGTDSKEVLKQLKQHPNLCSIPVIALSNGSEPEEVASLYQLGLNSYIVKAISTETFRSNMQLLVEYWFIASVLPPQKIGYP
ncbi:MAG: response regulator [Oculatellaceae cyanobacterium Prado106]|jgi:CheY-like chemotaxis protein|nr:response regulator [Oculatellaceae cyanobacterium Prado106]